MQIQDHGQIQPAFTHPNIADIACPFLVRRISREVPIQQVRRDVELVIAVGRDLMLTCSHDRDAVLTHQPANTAVPDVQADLFSLFRHAWPAITAEAETRLLFDMRQRDQIRPLSAAGGSAAESR